MGYSRFHVKHGKLDTIVDKIVKDCGAERFVRKHQETYFSAKYYKIASAWCNPIAVINVDSSGETYSLLVNQIFLHFYILSTIMTYVWKN